MYYTFLFFLKTNIKKEYMFLTIKGKTMVAHVDKKYK